MTPPLSWMGNFYSGMHYWHLKSGSASVHSNRNVDYEVVIIFHWTIGLIKINTLNLRTPFSDAWKCVSRHFEKGSSQIQGIYFDKSYSPVEYDDYFIINISIAIHRGTARILDVSNAFQNKNFPFMKEVVSFNHSII